MKLNQLSQSEKILLVEQLWDSIRSDAEENPLTAAQQAELDRRLADYELHPEEGDSWDNAKARILNQ
jgi:putative addiction module component (TIGR02574 family)